MNYTELLEIDADLNEDQKYEYYRYEVLEMILQDCEELRWDIPPPNADDLAEIYPAENIQELIREHQSYQYIPEDLVMDWDKFMIDYWAAYPEGYFLWGMKELAEDWERSNDIPHHP